MVEYKDLSPELQRAVDNATEWMEKEITEDMEKWDMSELEEILDNGLAEIIGTCLGWHIHDEARRIIRRMEEPEEEEDETDWYGIQRDWRLDHPDDRDW